MTNNCKRCEAPLVPKGPKDNNKKFCSATCRDSQYREDNKEYLNERQREYLRGKTKGEKIVCVVCGKDYRQVGTHITQRHNMTARQYREKYGFDVKRGQLPKDLRRKKRAQVFENNTVDNLKTGRLYRFKKGQQNIGTYKRSTQTMERLKQQSFIKKDKDNNNK